MITGYALRKARPSIPDDTVKKVVVRVHVSVSLLHDNFQEPIQLSSSWRLEEHPVSKVELENEPQRQGKAEVCQVYGKTHRESRSTTQAA